MLVENVKYFMANYDFDMVYEWISNADWMVVLMNPYILVPVIILVGMLMHPKTTGIAQMAVMVIPAVGFLFVTFVILSNDSISNFGPFIMAGISFFGIVGYLIWSQLLNN